MLFATYSPIAIIKLRKLRPTALMSTLTSVGFRGFEYTVSVVYSSLSSIPDAAVAKLTERPESFNGVMTRSGREKQDWV